MSSTYNVFFTLTFSHIGYTCPRCGAIHCEIPCHCKNCNLLLTTSGHLIKARNAIKGPLLCYNILNPESYQGNTERDIMMSVCTAIIKHGGEAKKEKQKVRCKGCERKIEVSMEVNKGVKDVSVCTKCQSVFCLYFY